LGTFQPLNCVAHDVMHFLFHGKYDWILYGMILLVYDEKYIALWWQPGRL